MKYEIDLPAVPEGYGAPQYRAVWLPVAETDLVMFGNTWRKAHEVVKCGGAFWIEARNAAGQNKVRSGHEPAAGSGYAGATGSAGGAR